MANTRPKKVSTYSYTLPPSINKRWERFAKELGHNRSTAFAKIIPKIIDAFAETEPVDSMQEYREVVSKNKAVFYPSKSGDLRMSIHIEIDLDNITE